MKTQLQKTAYHHLNKYDLWLNKQPLSHHTRRAYRSRLNHFLVFVTTTDTDFGDVFGSQIDRDFTVHEYKTAMKRSLKLSPATVNMALSAIDHFYSFLGLGRTSIRREDLPQMAPQALTEKEQKQFLRVIQSCKTKVRAVGLLLFCTGIRIGECAGLDLDDVYVSPRKGLVTIRSGKNGKFRTVPLHPIARTTLTEWIDWRKAKYATSKDQALFLNPQGKRISTAGIDLIVRKIGRLARLDISAHTLRHTCLTNLVRQGNDLFLVADIAGHKSLDTTRRYTLPSQEDLELAIERMLFTEE